MRAALLALFLCGCSASELVPSMKYCDEVKYERMGTDVTLEAKCKAPVG